MKVAIWARVSTSDQHTENQVHELRRWAERRGLEVVAEFVTEDSAWTQHNGSAKGKEFDAKRGQLLEGARLGHYRVVIAWAVDRLSRRGAEDMHSYVRKLTDTGCQLWCERDPWVESITDPMVRELILGVFATLARIRSEQASRNIKLGLERRKREGKPVGGRKKGAKDRKPRAKPEPTAERKAAKAAAAAARRDPATGRLRPAAPDR